MRILLGLAALSLLIPAPVKADDIIKLAPGETLVNLSATERSLVEPDILSASLRIELEDASAEKVQDRINKAMQQGIAKAKDNKAADTVVSTGQYYVYQHEREPVRPVSTDSKVPPVEKPAPVWRGSQTISLEGKDAKTILQSVAELQKLGFSMGNLNYSLSPKKGDVERDKLTEAALKSLQERANRIAVALGRKQAVLMEISIDSAMPYARAPRMVMMASADAMGGAAEKMSTPVVEAGEVDISLTVNARAVLK